MMKKNVIALSFGVIFFFGLAVPLRAQDAKEDAKDYYRLGTAYYEQGRYKEAEEMYAKALAIMEQAKQQPASVREPARIETAQLQPMPERRAPAQPSASEGFEYTIGQEDVLAVSVWQNPDLDSEVIVRPDGMISFPLVGDVKAQGLTVTELDSVLTGRLKEFVKLPEVSISIKKIGGQRVLVLGEVMQPGIYSLTGSRTLLEAVAMAGGFTTHAVPSSTVLIRGGLESPKAERINLSKTLASGRKAKIVLNSEDIVFIPKKFIANLNYFLSQVLDPIAKGAYTRDQLRNW